MKSFSFVSVLSIIELEAIKNRVENFWLSAEK